MNIIPCYTSDQKSDIIPSFGIVQLFLKGFDTSHGIFKYFIINSYNFDFFTEFDLFFYAN